MDLRLYFRLFRRRWIAIVLLTVLGAAAGAAAAWSQPATYAVKTGMFVTTTNSGADLGQAYQGTLLAQQRAQTYTTLMTDDHVLRILISQLNLPYSVGQLRGEISASNPGGTAVLNVTVTDRSGDRALAIANAYGPVFSKFADGLDISGAVPTAGTATGQPDLKVIPLAPAELAPVPVTLHKALDIGLGVAAGLVLGIGWAVVREITDTRIRDAEDVERASGSRVLGLLPGDATGPQEPRPIGPRPIAQRRLSTVEAYRRLVVNIQLAISGPAPLTLVVTAPVGGEGATAVATDLAITFAEGGDKVVLVDANLGRPGPGGLLGLPPAPGLRDVLAGQVPVDRALRSWRDGLPLAVLTSGSAVPGSGNVLRDDRVVALRGELESKADIVIFAAPPLLMTTDAVILARVVGQALLVARAKVTHSQELADSVGHLREARVTVSGVVLHQVAGRRRRRSGVPASDRAESQLLDLSVDATVGEDAGRRDSRVPDSPAPVPRG